ncbi:DUF2975 domain-containing protein [Flavobacterium terrae]|uniref:DUF2975 domain-containing protein n=1 Tax=Flavobacterium terrae TaxID=415425 RepID=A0A1M6GUP3_9FLAO|nr:DUF2975 domain-containing protein [Flavobacterium terrae]SHJ13635.1 Protein of unknown function [Flavobacterium terrae]
MEIKIGTNQILKVLHVLSWIIFFGLCIEASAIAFNASYTFIKGSYNVHGYWNGADFSNLYNFDKGYFFVIILLMIIVGVLKCIMFYLIVKIFMDKKLSLSQPFSEALKKFILLQSIIAFGIGLFCAFANKYRIHLTKQGVEIPELEVLKLEGSSIWIFMSIILFIIVQIVKKGIEIREENDLTI